MINFKRLLKKLFLKNSKVYVCYFSSFLRQTAFYFQILFKIHVRLIIHRYLHRCFRSAAQYYFHHDGRYGVRRYELLWTKELQYSQPG